MIRDRLLELKKASCSLNVSSDSPVIIDTDEYMVCSHSLDMDNLLKMYNNIQHKLNMILANMVSMETMTQAKNSKEFNERDFHQLRSNTIQIGNRLLSKFKLIATNLPNENDYSTLGRMKRSLYYGFFQHYVIIWTKNNEFFDQYEEKLRKNLQMQARILNCDLSEDEIDTLIAHKITNLYAGNILETEKTRKTLQALKGHLCEIQKLEKSIEEVHSLFIRLQTLIMDQGVIMQRIEKHFGYARDYVEVAAIELKEAENLKNSNRKTSTILVAIAVLVASLFFWKKDKKQK